MRSRRAMSLSSGNGIMNIEQGTPNDEVKATSKFISPCSIFNILKKYYLT